MIDHVLDEAAILKLVARLAQASDDRDAAVYRSCFADTVSGGTAGETVVTPADDYVRDAMNRLTWTEWTHHRLINPIVDVEPSRKRATASIDVVVKLCRTDDWGARFRGTFGGRYQLGFVRAKGGWRIDHRALVRRYVYCEPAEPPVANPLPSQFPD